MIYDTLGQCRIQYLLPKCKGAFLSDVPPRSLVVYCTLCGKNFACSLVILDSAAIICSCLISDGKEEPIYSQIPDISQANVRVLWLVFPQCRDKGTMAFHILAASWRHQCRVLESASAAYPVLCSPQWQGCGLGPQEEWAYHQSQWPQQQSEWRLSFWLAYDMQPP